MFRVLSLNSSRCADGNSNQLEISHGTVRYLSYVIQDLRTLRRTLQSTVVRVDSLPVLKEEMQNDSRRRESQTQHATYDEKRRI